MADRDVMLVTGGSRGIGAAIVRLAGQGRQVAFFYRSSRAEAEACVRAAAAEGVQATPIQADVSDEASLLRGFEAVDKLGTLRVLVNNAGVTGGRSRLEDVTAAQLDEVLRVNVAGAFLCAREAVRRMSPRRGGAGGCIVNISSGAAKSGSPNAWIHYAATKGAMDTMTLGLAREVAAEGIRVNAVRPGVIATDIHADRSPEQFEAMTRMIPQGRMGQPEEVARMVLWLASEQASYVTGGLFDVSGGL
ncbi:SDR family oxidoreductase [Ramlibacter sp. AW1]|uniref:SDR family oxidoreductase n=1 Tax=Ramlibacter aurantiacus TaxID=2801330 RepID=A0A937D1N9_9BURK|nr:SDR family oxidoreductase [Ramlibacter aurantiacus]MBL0420724.1 SDR family oxidoreductase [Ramlibacter aurantiacus]